MDKGLITEQTLSDIASAIRDVYGESDTYYPSEFAEKIRILICDPTTNGLWVNYGAGYVQYELDGTIIPAYTFASQASLIGAKWNQCEEIGASAFDRCYSLASVSFPACTSIGSSAFDRCSALASVSFPVCTSIGAGAFQWCSALASVSFPVCTSIGGGAFNQCSALASVSFPVCTNIGNMAFYNCPALSEARFMAGQVATLGGSSVFYSTHASLKIYVPSSLYSDYLSAPYWSALSSRLYSA